MKFQILVVLLALSGIANAFVKHRIFRHVDSKWSSQIDELKKDVTSPEELKEKVFKFYEGLENDKEEFLSFYKTKCISWIKKVTSEEEQVELKALYDAKDYTTLSAKLKEHAERLPTEKQEKVKLWSKTCAFLWDAEELPLKRVRRSTFSYDLLETGWLTDSQKEELTLLTSDPSNFNKKYLDAFNALSADDKTTIADKIVKKCYAWLKDAATDGEREELEQLHHKDHAQCKQKIREYLARLDGGQQDKIRKHLNVCESIWYSSHHANPEHNHHGHHHDHRRRRHEGHQAHHHTLEDYLKTHLSWLTVEQAEELKKLKADGKTADELQKKVFEYYDAAEGETKTKATELLQGGCRELLQAVVGEEKAKEVKALKESGTSNEDISKKIKEMLETVTDEHKKELVNKYESACKKVFGVTSRRRRDHHEHGQHKIEDYLKTHLSWLTAEQGDELKKMEADKKSPEEMQKKIFEFYDAAEGETKTKATELLQGGCRELLQKVVGEEKANEIKALKESGATKEDLYKKVKELLDGVTDEHKKELANKYENACKKVFGVESRKRRHEGKIGLEDFMENHLSWLTPEQKTEISALKDNVEAFEKKVHEFYQATTGETRVKATEDLQASCRELMHWILGDKFDEITKMKESGADKTEIAKKVEELYSQVTDEEKKKKGDQYKAQCKKLFGVESRRRRHDHGHGQHTLEDYLKTHLSWLTVEQADELKKLKADGKTADELQAKVFEYYDAAQGETKTKATELLQGGCRELLQAVVGEEKAKELKTLRESGASKDDLANKVKELMDAVTDEHKKELVKKYEGPCKRVFGVVSRKRREGDEQQQEKLEDYLNKHLAWLTEDQKAEMRKMNEQGKSDAELQAAVMNFYDAAEGDTKSKATELLQGACKEIIGTVIGQEKTAELTKMKESGATQEELASKVKTFIDEVKDGKKKEIAKKYKDSCRKVYNVSIRSKRHEGKVDLDDFIENHLGWLTAEQKTEVLNLKTDKEAFEKKINEFYHATTGETRVKATEDLQASCRELMHWILGDKFDEITKMKESGADKTEIAKKVEELYSQVTDEEKKKKGEEYKAHCKKLFGVESRKRRHDHGHDQHKIEDYLKTHLSWLTVEQGDELKKMEADKKSPEELQKKIFEFYDAAEGETKTKATELLQGGCRELLQKVVGEEKANEIKSLKESGATKEDLYKKVKELLDGVTDEHKKELANKYESACKKVFGVESRKRRDHHDHHSHGQHTLEDYLKTHLSWLTVEQAEELKKLKAEGKTADELQKKVFEYYDAAEGETKTKATELLQGGCRELLQAVVGGEKAKEVKALKESGTSNEDISKKIKEMLETVTDEHKKELVNKYESACKKVFGVTTRRRRDHHHEHGQHKIEDYLKTHLSWLTAEQGDELKKMEADKKSPEELQKKIFEFYDAAEGETKTKATELLQGGCRELLQKVVGEEKANEIKTLKESGATKEDLYKKVKELLDGVTDEHKKELANKYENACKKVFGVASRKRRDFEDVPSIERFMQIHSIWLTQEQKDEISELGNVSEDILDKKIDEFFETTTGETRRKAIDAMKSACRQLIEKAIGEDNVNELSNMKINRKSLKEIEARLDEFIGEISDEYLKDHVMQKKQYCVKIYKLYRHRRETDNDDGEEDETVGNRRRRHEDDSTTEGFVKNHLFWLTDEQKEEFLKLKDSRDAMHKKLDEFYNAATGETKEKATESMKGACRELVFKAIGEERTNEIKAMKESGKTFPEIEAKIEEYLKDVTDEKLKGYIQEHSDRCRSYFKQATRMRRHRIEEDAEDLETVVVAKELPIENLEEPKVIESSVDASKVGTKTRRHNNYDGDHHDHDGHQHRMRRNDDEENDTDNTFYEPDSRIVDYRRKRDHHHEHGQHKIEDYLKTHLSWLTVEQGDELKKMEADKKSPEELQKKIFEFYDAAEGETKTKATELLQGGCRELLQKVVGEEKANEIKALKESGATKEDLYKKVKEFLDQVTDEHKKELANKYESACKKVFGVASRKRRDHHDHHSHGQHTLEDYLKTHLSWLTVEQAEELKKLKADGKTPEEIQQKVFAYYDAAEGETKTKATELLQGGCRELVTSVIGEEKANEIKAFKDSGASNNDVAKKVFDLVDQADASSKKDLVKKYESACKKVFGVSTRKRREEEGNKFESYVTKYLSWLTDDQKQNLREMRSEGKTREEMQNKLFEYYDMTDGDLKQTATESLQNACRDLLGKVLEPAQSEELKSLKASGKSIQELSSKVDEFLKDVEDENKKELIQKYSTGCKRVFGLAQSRKRRTLKPKLTHIDFIKAVIGNENLPELTHQELSYKIMDVYDAQTISENAREIVNQCHHMFAETVSLGFYMADYSARELLHSLRSASNRQLSSVAAIAELCTQAIKELKSTEGRHGSVGDTLIKLFNELDDETKQRLGTQWRSRCSDWIVEITDEEERSFLRMLFRTQQFEILRERINEFISRFDDTTRTEVGHMRPICEQLLGLTHHGRKFYQRRIPVEEVF